MKNRLKIVLNIGVLLIAAAFVLSAVMPPAVSLGADGSSQVQPDQQAPPPATVSSPAQKDQKKKVSTSTDDIEYDDSYDDDDDEWEG